MIPFQVVGTVPLHMAIYQETPGAFDALLAGPGGEVAANTKDSEGATPLHIACRKQGSAAPEAMALLREGCPVKVDVGVVDKAGRTPLADATHHGHVEVVKVRRGLDVWGWGWGAGWEGGGRAIGLARFVVAHSGLSVKRTIENKLLRIACSDRDLCFGGCWLPFGLFVVFASDGTTQLKS